MDIRGLSRDGSGIRGYSDMEWKGEGWTSLDYPWMVTVTPAYGDTLTWSGRGGGGKGGRPWSIHGGSQLLSAKYKATVHPWMAVDCLRHHWTYLERRPCLDFGLYPVSIACLQSQIDSGEHQPLQSKKPNQQIHFRLHGTGAFSCGVPIFVWVLINTM